MTRLPRRRTREKMGVRQSSVIRSPGHLQFIRGFSCVLTEAKKGVHECFGAVQAAHVRTGTDGGVAMKPGDNWTIPLCDEGHAEQHRIGEAAFERMYGIDMKAIAARLWNISPPGKRYRNEQMKVGEG